MRCRDRPSPQLQHLLPPSCPRPRGEIGHLGWALRQQRRRRQGRWRSAEFGLHVEPPSAPVADPLPATCHLTVRWGRRLPAASVGGGMGWWLGRLRRAARPVDRTAAGSGRVFTRGRDAARARPPPPAASDAVRGIAAPAPSRFSGAADRLWAWWRPTRGERGAQCSARACRCASPNYRIPPASGPRRALLIHHPVRRRRPHSRPAPGRSTSSIPTTPAALARRKPPAAVTATGLDHPLPGVSPTRSAFKATAASDIPSAAARGRPEPTPVA